MSLGKVIRFIRVKGRVIAIKASKRPGAIAGDAMLGSVIGFAGGQVAAVKANEPDVKYIGRNYGKHAVSVKSAVSKSGIKGVKAVTSLADAQKHGDKIHPWIRSKGFWDSLKKNPNAFFVSPQGGGRGGFIVTKGNKVNKSIISHELGHAKDYNRGGGKPLPGGILSGDQYRTEVKAWKLAPHKYDREMKKRALKTYERNRDYSRWGTALGAAAGAIAALR